MSQTVDYFVPWRKQSKQLEFLRACGLTSCLEPHVPPQPPAADVIFYGGAAGGGKTDALLALGLTAAAMFPGCQVGFFRREYPQLEGPGGAIMRSKEMFKRFARWNGQQRRWTFRNGSIIQFCHAKNEDDVYSYQSQQFDLLLIDESTHFTRYQLRYLITRNRATTKGVWPFTALASNPGNVGHGYHKSEFIDPGPPGQVHNVEVEPGYFEKHLFIPAFLQDNEVLEERDPGYRSRLERQPEEVRKALLEGDWSIFAGQFFKTFRKYLHTCEPFAIPAGWKRFASMDWGFAAPCSVLWHAIDPANRRIYTYREIYVTEMRPEEVAILYNDLSQDEEIMYVSASPDCWQERGLQSKQRGGESIAEVMLDAGMPLTQADNRRVMGWTRIRDYLSLGPDGLPYWIIFDNCTHLIRTLPELIHDDKHIEDVSDKCEDHAPEAARYGLMSRPSPIDGNIITPGGLPGEGQKTWSFEDEEGRDEWEDEEISDEPGFY